MPSKMTPKVRIEQTGLSNYMEDFYHVIIQQGPKRDDDRDQLIALCLRRVDAKRIKDALEATWRKGR